MKKFGLTDSRLKIEGLYGFTEHRRFRRYTDEIVAAYPRLSDADNKCAGVRLRFRTDSKRIRVEMRLSNQFVDRGMSFYQANTAYHNAPTVEHLRQTHEVFFRLFRSIDPLTPVIMTSRPADDTAETAERTAIVRTTYENARRGDDRNVYFMDGLTLFGDTDQALCTTDRAHPNDLGHYKIAKTLEDLIRRENLLNPDALSVKER